MLIGRLTGTFSASYYLDMQITTLFESLKSVKRRMEQDTLPTLLTQEAARVREKLSARQKASAVDRREAAAILKSAQALEADAHMLSAEAIRSNEDGFAKISERFQQDVADMDAQTEQASAMLEHAFDFLARTFGKSQEMVVFVTELNTNFFCTWFIGQNGSEAYTRCNKELMIGKQKQELMGDIKKIHSFLTVLE